MKRILLLSTILILALTAFSQTFSVTTTETNSLGYADDYDIYDVVPITNETNDVIVVSWERTLEDVPNGWDISNCSPCQCHPIGVTSSSGCYFSNTNLTAYVNTHFYPNGIVGSGQVKMKIWDESTFDEIIVTFNATAQEPLVSISDNTTSSYLRSYPNPFNERLNLEFNYTNVNKVTLEVVDLLGKTVLVKTGLNSNDRVVVNEELNAGIYFCVLKSNGKILDRIKVKKI